MMKYLMIAEGEDLKEKKLRGSGGYVMPEFQITSKKKVIWVGLSYLLQELDDYPKIEF